MLYNIRMKKIILVILILSLCVFTLGVLAACGPSPVGIVVKTSPKSKTVPQGGQPDLTGGVVTVTYSDETTKDVPMSELEQRGLNTAELGKQTLVLVYTEGKMSFSTTVEMTVALAKATRLELATDNVKKNYFSGENFDRRGLVVTAYYETGNVAEITNYEISPTRLTSGTAEVTVSYRSARAVIPVTVVDRAPSKLEITKAPTKTTYYMGDTFSAEGLTALVTFNDGTTQSFAASELRYSHKLNGMEYLSPDFATDDVVLVTATTALGEITGELKISVSEVLPVQMTATVTEGELSFLEGSDFSFGGKGNVSVFIRYNNGDTETVVATDDIFFAPSVPLEAGQTSVQVTLGDYDAVKATVPITVRPLEVESIQILSAPKRQYEAGEPVDLSGLILLVRLTGGASDQVLYSAESGITCTPTVVAADTIMITVHYQGCSATFALENE